MVSKSGYSRFFCSADLQEEDAYSLSYDWFVCDGEDITEVQGLSLGRVLQIYVFEYLYPKANSLANSKTFAGFMKRRGYDWHLRFLLGKIGSLFQGSVGEKPPIAFLYDVNNKPMIANLNLVAREMVRQNHNIFAIAVDANIARQIDGPTSLRYYAQSYNPAMENQVLKTSSRLKNRLESGREDIKRQIERFFQVSDRELTRFLSFMKRQFAQAIRELYALEKMLHELDSRVVVSSTDAHRISRMVTFLSKEIGCKTLVIQHGAPVWKYGYVPVFADGIIVWGKSSETWFLENGVPQEKIIVAGCPRYDHLERLSDDGYWNDRSRPALYYLTNPIDPAINRRIIEAVLSLDTSGFERVAIKPHPSERDIDFYKRATDGVAQPKIEILLKSDLTQVIRKGDIVIVANSTAGIDVIALGGILISLDIEGISNSIPYKQFEAAITASIDKLDDAVRRAMVVRSAAGASGHLAKCRNFLGNYLCGPDGQATGRIASYIESIAN